MVSMPRAKPPPDPKPPPAPPPVPERSDTEVQALAEEQRLALQARRGRAKTWLTGGMGASTTPTTAVRFLGGAAET
jgi:hypothetical protein